MLSSEKEAIFTKGFRLPVEGRLTLKGWIMSVNIHYLFGMCWKNRTALPGSPSKVNPANEPIRYDTIRTVPNNSRITQVHVGCPWDKSLTEGHEAPMWA